MNSKLNELARHALNGACNPKALLRELAVAIEDLSPQEVRESPAVKCVLGQVTFLCGEGLGPSLEAMQAFGKEGAK